MKSLAYFTIDDKLSLLKYTPFFNTARAGKHTDVFIKELVNSISEGKTNCPNWNTYGWGCRKRVLPSEINHQIGRENTQRLKTIIRILRQQTGQWYRRQIKSSKICDQTKETVWLMVSYFNWIWVHSRLKTTAAQRAGLTEEVWTWENLAAYPTLL